MTKLWLCCRCCFPCWSRMWSSMVGKSTLNLVRGLRFRNSSDGVILVTECGVFLYWNKQLASWCFSERFLPPLFILSTCLRNACFRICTVRSAAPLEDGWYGGTSVCLIPFCLRKLVKSWEINWDPLSETTSSGKPYTANQSLIWSIVLWAVVDLMCATSIHLEWLSTNPRK